MSVKSVELVYFTGCPNADAARESIREAMQQVGDEEAWSEWDLTDGATPARYRSFASPTVLVDGRDVLGQQASVQGLSCRAEGAPSTSEVLQAIRPDV